MVDRAPKYSTATETKFLMHCASPMENQERCIRFLNDEKLNWDLLLDLAASHAITPLLYWKLKAISPHRISKPLEAAFQSNVRKSLRLTGELLQLEQLLRREGVPVLHFKGPTLAMAAFGNLALRQFVDLDLLVPEMQVLQARDLLLASGYGTNLQLSPRRLESYLRLYDEFVLFKDDGRTLIELHWAVTPHRFSVPLQIASFWDRSTSIWLAGREVPSLCTEDLLLVLCVHGAKHCWSRLSMVADVAWIIAREPNVKWDSLLERAHAIGSLRMVLLGIALAATILRAPLPQSLLSKIESDQTVCRLAARVTAHLYYQSDQPGSIFRSGIFHMQSRERWQDRVRYLFRLFATPGVEDWRLADLPSSLDFLYPVLRFPRLLRKYWRRVP